jgi:hypothetical protein
MSESILFTNSSCIDITEFKDLCNECQIEQNNIGNMYWDVMEQYQQECSCKDSRICRYSFIIVKIAEQPVTKSPSDCVFIISIYISEEEINIFNFEDLIPTQTFSIYKSMDSDISDIKNILKQITCHFPYDHNSVTPYNSFKGIKNNISYIKEFFSIYKEILNSKEIIKEQKTNPHMKKKEKKKRFKFTFVNL